MKLVVRPANEIGQDGTCWVRDEEEAVAESWTLSGQFGSSMAEAVYLAGTRGYVKVGRWSWQRPRRGEGAAVLMCDVESPAWLARSREGVS